MWIINRFVSSLGIAQHSMPQGLCQLGALCGLDQERQADGEALQGCQSDAPQESPVGVS